MVAQIETCPTSGFVEIASGSFQPVWHTGDMTDNLNAAFCQARKFSNAFGGGVVILEAKTYPYGGHVNSQDGTPYREGAGVRVLGNGAVLQPENELIYLGIQTNDRFENFEIRGKYADLKTPWQDQPDWDGANLDPTVKLGLGQPGLNGSLRNNWVVDNLAIHGIRGFGILGSQTQGATIKNSQVFNNGVSGLLSTRGAAGWCIKDNDLYENGQNGADINGSTTTLWRNRAHKNGWAHSAAPGADIHGLMLWAAPKSDGNLDLVNSRIFDNICYENEGAGIWVGATYAASQTKVVGTKIQGNRVYSNKMSGILVLGLAFPNSNEGAEITNNIVDGNAHYGIGFGGLIDTATVSGTNTVVPADTKGPNRNGCIQRWDGVTVLNSGAGCRQISTQTCVEAGEDMTWQLTCPAGMVVAEVQFADWGQAFSDWGTMNGICPTYTKNPSCKSDQTTNVETMCLGHSACSVVATNDALGIDPCVGNVKSLKVQVGCDSNYTGPTPCGDGVCSPTETCYTCPSECGACAVQGCAEAGENMTWSLSCPAGMTVRNVHFAEYGTPISDWGNMNGGCPTYSSGWCRLDKTALIESLCLNNKSCWIFVTNSSMGGDPCYGTAKVLKVGVDCAP